MNNVCIMNSCGYETGLKIFTLFGNCNHRLILSKQINHYVYNLNNAIVC